MLVIFNMPEFKLSFVVISEYQPKGRLPCITTVVGRWQSEYENLWHRFRGPPQTRAADLLNVSKYTAECMALSVAYGRKHQSQASAA